MKTTKINNPFTPRDDMTDRWLERAMCSGDSRPDDWFADRGSAELDRARTICAMCTVAAMCESAARKRGETEGLWGTYKHRAGTRAACGTRGGYRSHKRFGEVACTACDEANKLYTRQCRERMEDKNRKADRAEELRRLQNEAPMLPVRELQPAC